MKIKACSKCGGKGGKYRKTLKDYTCDKCEEKAFDSLFVLALKGRVGKKISRSEALRISRKTLLDAERERRQDRSRGMKLTFIVANCHAARMDVIHGGFSRPPTKRSVSIELTTEQVQKIGLKMTGYDSGEETTEEILEVFVET